MGDPIKLLRLKPMKRISHFVWLRKQFYQAGILNVLKILFFSFHFSFQCLASVEILPGKMKGRVDDSAKWKKNKGWQSHVEC